MIAVPYKPQHRKPYEPTFKGAPAGAVFVRFAGVFKDQSEKNPEVVFEGNWSLFTGKFVSQINCGLYPQVVNLQVVFSTS